MLRRLVAKEERWPFRTPFTIARGSRIEARVLVARIVAGDTVGRGEAVPYPRYGETVEDALDLVRGLEDAVAGGLDRAGLQEMLPPGAARNAVDCAMWDLDSKLAGKRAWQLADLPPPRPCTTAYTLSVDTPEAMAIAAAAAADLPLLKVKLTGEGDMDRVRAVREAAPRSRLIVDANESWSADQLHAYTDRMAALGVAMIEQPLPAGDDGALAGFDSPVPICADESCHDRASLQHLAGKYAMVNIKLDKTGGLTEALKLKAAARGAGFGIMVGCMVGTSLAMAPALLVADGADYVDLDGPLVMGGDRQPGLVYRGTVVEPPEPALWG
ncbi:MAG: dipeptide epimerase [Rhodospirillaceae bacterium]|nr:dipeptide epimerase [Rhodospirillaceae bacterium]